MVEETSHGAVREKMDGERLTGGLTINHLFRYVYSGLLALVMLSSIDPQAIHSLQKELQNNVLSALAIISFGGAIYASYRSFSEYSVQWFFDVIHRGIQRSTCKYVFLERFGVRGKVALNTFRVIRDTNPTFKPIGTRYALYHSENHLLFETFVIAASAAVYLWLTQWGQCIAFLDLRKTFHLWVHDANCASLRNLTILAFASFVFGISGDILLCRIECAHLREIPEWQIQEVANRQLRP